MSSSWKPSVGMQQAELLVQVLETEAAASDGKIGPLFRHRLVEHLTRAFDRPSPTLVEQMEQAVNRAFAPQVLTAETLDNTHTAHGFTNGAVPAPVAAAEVEKTKAAKRGRGRPRKN